MKFGIIAAMEEELKNLASGLRGQKRSGGLREDLF